MSKRGENIYRRKDGRWEARYVMDYTPDGKAQYGYCYAHTYGEVKQKLTDCQVRTRLGIPEPGMMGRLLTDFCDGWLTQQRIRVRESSCLRYETILRLHIIPCLGGLRPAVIREDAVDLSTKRLLDEGLMPKTVRDILTVLKSVLEYAARQQGGFRAVPKITYPKVEKKEARVLTAEEEGQLVRYLLKTPDPCRFGILLALMTGLRIGELCALRWEHIRPDSAYTDTFSMEIRASLSRIQCPETHKNTRGFTSAKDREPLTRIVIGPPKTGTSVRVIPLTKEISALCEQFRAGPECYVLTGTDSYLLPRTLQYRFSVYTASCGLRDVHFHTLRHTFATQCVESGMEIKSLSEILGHAGTGITLGCYVHSSPEMKRRGLERVTIPGLD